MRFRRKHPDNETLMLMFKHAYLRARKAGIPQDYLGLVLKDAEQQFRLVAELQQLPGEDM